MNYTYNKRKMFDYLLGVAQQRKISKRKLCEGLYDSSTFNKICLGYRSPSLELILNISRKLNISLETLEHCCTFEKPSEILYIKHKFECYRLVQNYKALENLYHTYKLAYAFPESATYTLFLWMEAIIEMTININYAYAQELLIRVIKTENPSFDISNISLTDFNEKQLDILHDLAFSIYLNDHEKFTEALRIYEILVDHITINNNYISNKALLPKFCYQIGFILLKENKYHDEAEKYTDIGIKYAEKNIQLTKLPYLYRNCAIIMAFKGNKKSSEYYFRNCIELFRMQGRDENFINEGLAFMKSFHIEL